MADLEPYVVLSPDTVEAMRRLSLPESRTLMKPEAEQHSLKPSQKSSKRD